MEKDRVLLACGEKSLWEAAVKPDNQATQKSTKLVDDKVYTECYSAISFYMFIEYFHRNNNYFSKKGSYYTFLISQNLLLELSKCKDHYPDSTTKS